MIQEKDFEAYIGDNGLVVFAIEAKQSELSNPKLQYAGGQHALLCRDEVLENAIILDYLHPRIQEQLKKSVKALIAEIDYDEEKVVRDYEVVVEQVMELPAFQLSDDE